MPVVPVWEYPGPFWIFLFRKIFSSDFATAPPAQRNKKTAVRMAALDMLQVAAIPERPR
jgi:hypothetical protein